MASATGAKAISASTRRATSPSMPNKRADESIDLKELIDQLQARGIQLPILLRFTDILRHRVGEIHDAFRQAIEEFDYQRQLLLRLSRSRSTSSGTSSRRSSISASRSTSAWRPAPSRSCWPCWR